MIDPVTEEPFNATLLKIQYVEDHRSVASRGLFSAGGFIAGGDLQEWTHLIGQAVAVLATVVVGG